VRGRVKGAPAFRRFVADTRERLAARRVEVETVNFIVTPRSGVEQLLLHVDGDEGRIELPMALCAERTEDRRIVELRIYFSARPLTGRPAIRPPLLQPDPDLHVPAVVGEHQRATGDGTTFAREPCAVTDDGRACAVEYNVVAWGQTPLPPQAGLGVYVRGASGEPAAARFYDDAEPPQTGVPNTQRRSR
jgi:hypothetical protein